MGAFVSRFREYAEVVITVIAILCALYAISDMKPKNVLPGIPFLLLSVTVSESYKILGIFHSASKSHYITGEKLMRGLAKKGHDVTVISPFPQSKPLQNFHDVPIIGIKKLVEDILPRSKLADMDNMCAAEKYYLFLTLGLTMTNYTLNHESFQHFLLDKDVRFDVIIMEVFMNEAFLGIGHYFNAPMVAFSTLGATKLVNDMVGTPTPMSYVPHIFSRSVDLTTFPKRVLNVLLYICDVLFIDWLYMPQQVKIYDAMFPDPKPRLEQLRKNVSLVLLNSHFSLSSPRPYLPNMIEVGGLQINRTPKQLPSDLQKVLDEAVHGVIYFSLGTNIKANSIPVDKPSEILSVFRTLNQTVLWKWDEPLADEKPDNVHVSSWFPQDDLLAHPNVKLFITHGGLFSITETIYHAVPVVGIPIFGDQHINMASAESLGYGKTIPLKELNRKSLSAAITEVLSNDKYAKKIKVLSERYRDQPLTPLETAIYWTEYVARHKGAPHLRSAGLDLSFFAYHSLDVFAALLTALYLLWTLVKWGACRIVSNFCEKNIVNMKKVN